MSQERTVLTDAHFVWAKEHRLGTDQVYEARSFWKDAALRFCKNKGAVFGLVMIVVIIALAILGPSMSGYDYRTQEMSQRNLPPHIAGWDNAPIFNGKYEGYNVYQEKGIENVTHIFGTDTLGRDLFARTWTGTRISLYVALLAILIDTIALLKIDL